MENLKNRTKSQLIEIATDKGIDTATMTKHEILTILENEIAPIEANVVPANVEFTLLFEMLEDGEYKTLSRVEHTKETVEQFAKTFKRAISNTAKHTSFPHFYGKQFRLSIDEKSVEFIGGEFGKGIRPLLEVIASARLVEMGSNEMTKWESVQELGASFMSVFTIKDDFIELCKASARYSTNGISIAQKARIVEGFKAVVLERIKQTKQAIEGTEILQITN